MQTTSNHLGYRLRESIFFKDRLRTMVSVTYFELEMAIRRTWSQNSCNRRVWTSLVFVQSPNNPAYHQSSHSIECCIPWPTTRKIFDIFHSLLSPLVQLALPMMHQERVLDMDLLLCELFGDARLIDWFLMQRFL